MSQMLEDAVEALAFARQGTIAEAENIPLDQWDFRPHPNAMNVSKMLRHIIDATLVLVGEAADPEGDYRRRSPAEHTAAHAGHLPAELTPAELLDALRSSQETSADRIRTPDAEHWLRPITRFDGKTLTRMTYLFYAASHEQYHCGQLATYARSLGLIPALTKRIHGEDAK